MATDPLQPLTPQQETFVTAYVVGGLANATEAAIQAGYSPNSARGSAARLLAKANIQAAVQRKQAVIAVRVEYSHSDWLRDVQSTVNEARQAGSHAAALKGYELLGRHIGALKSDRGLSREQADLFTHLGAAMERANQLASQSDSEVIELPENSVRELEGEGGTG